jgi:hypothetical protein
MSDDKVWTVSMHGKMEGEMFDVPDGMTIHFYVEDGHSLPI